MEKTDPLLRISHVRKSFGTLEVLKDISIDVYKGDVVSILGPSGSGKTTLLRCINFLERADSGSITLDDTTIDLKAATREQASEVQRKTGFVFQNYNLFRNKTALENITLGLTSGRGVSKEDANKKGMMLFIVISQIRISQNRCCIDILISRVILRSNLSSNYNGRSF